MSQENNIITEAPIEIKEETVMETVLFTAEQEALIAALMAGGVTREMAIAQMNALAGMNPAAPAPTAPVTPQPEAPKAEGKGVKVKSWFKNAVDKMNVSTKATLISELTKQKLTTKDAAEKAEIEAELAKLRGEGGDARFEKMKGYIANVKGWSVDASGKVADALYVTGDYAEKATSGATKLVGKATKSVGEAIVKTGEFIEEGAETVGKVARMPMDAAGDLINVANGTKKVEKKK
jgi:hypothetical protein